MNTRIYYADTFLFGICINRVLLSSIMNHCFKSLHLICRTVFIKKINLFSDKPNVSLLFKEASPFTLTFTLTADDSSNSLQYYTLQYRTDDSNGWIKKISKIPPTRTSYELRDLQPYTEYIVELYGTNKHFTSDSFQVKVRTSTHGELYF